MAAARKRKGAATASPKLRRYKVSGEVTVSVSTTVWAKSPAQAWTLAAQRAPSTGLVDSGDETSEWVAGDELDGDVKIVECEQADGGPEEDET